MCHVEVERLSLHHLNHRRASVPDVIFVVPRDAAMRGIGVDPRQGIFLMLQSNERVFPLLEGPRDDDILALRILAVEVDDIADQRVLDFVTEKLSCALGEAM